MQQLLLYGIIRLLEEGKSADHGKWGLVAGYSERLMDLYQRQGQRDKLIKELEYHIFVLSSGGMEMLNRLKKACMPTQWIEYRERYLSGRNYHKLELMESEGLWERLMKAVAAAENLLTLDHFETSLKKTVSERDAGGIRLRFDKRSRYGVRPKAVSGVGAI